MLEQHLRLEEIWTNNPAISQRAILQISICVESPGSSDALLSRGFCSFCATFCTMPQSSAGESTCRARRWAARVVHDSDRLLPSMLLWMATLQPENVI